MKAARPGNSADTSELTCDTSLAETSVALLRWLSNTPPQHWSPQMVASALDHSDRSRQLLARRIHEITQTIAGRELRSWGILLGRWPEDLSKDVVQDVMVKLFADGDKVLRRWDPQRGLGLQGFVRLMVRRHLSYLQRSARANPLRRTPPSTDHADHSESNTPSPFDRVYHSELQRLLLARESARSRSLYAALFIEQQSGVELAHDVGMAPDALYQWRRRFTHRARKVMASVERSAPIAAPRRAAGADPAPPVLAAR